MTLSSLTALLDAARIGGLQTTRGGRIVARVSRPDAKGASYLSQLVELDGASALPLTRGAASIGPSALAEDGTTFFAAKRRGEDGEEREDAVLWALPPRGEALQLATRPGGFGTLAVGGGRIVAEVPVHSQAADEAAHAERSKARSESKTSGVLHSGFPLRYWDADLGPARDVLAVAELPTMWPLAGPSAASDAEDAGAGTDGIDDEGASEPSGLLSFRHALMPEGLLDGWVADEELRFALVGVRGPIEGHLDATSLWVIDLVDGAAPRPVALADGSVHYSPGAISPDGTRALIGVSRHWTPTQDMVWGTAVLDLATNEHSPLWPEHDFWLDTAWLDDATVVAASDDLGRGSLWVGAADAPSPRRLAGGPAQELTFGSPLIADGAIVTTASGIAVAPFPIRVDAITGEVTALPNPADTLEAPGTLREVTATAVDGTPIRAWLRVPEGEWPHPLVVFAHGGPWGSWNAWTFRWNPNPFVEAGYAVLLPDPAISTGYGQHMIARGQQELGGAPYTDILALADAAEAEPDVDESRTAFAGGSYGGYMANWVAGHTADRFACIVTHASLWNVDSMGATTDNGEWRPAMAQQEATQSPHRFVKDIQVPMLVIHGDKDYRVPFSQGLELWYDLQAASSTPKDSDGKTQHRFLYYPDEGHWILKRGNAEAWYRTFIGFLDQHVLGKETEPLDALG